MNKRALSPLIATILLIAFAVALGTLIMSWTVEPHGQDHATPCQDVRISLQKVPGGEAICYAPQEQRIRFVVKNDGKADVPLIMLRAIDRELNIKEKEIPADLTPGGAGRFELPFTTLTPGEVAATLTPIEVIDGVQHSCADKEIERLAIPLC